MYAAFPTTHMRHGQLYNSWQQCQLYSRHILSLKVNYKKKAADRSEPLQSSNRSCQLLRKYFRYFLLSQLQLLFDIARFLLEAGSYQELADVLEVARSAYERVDDANERDPIVIDQYHSFKGTILVHRGLFEETKPHQIHTFQFR